MDKLAQFFTRLMEKYLPGPFILVIFLTIFVIFLAIITGSGSFIEITRYWGDGFWDLIDLTLQITVIFAAGYVVANTSVVNNILDKLIQNVHSPRVAVVITTLVSAIGCWFNFGIGLISGVIVARKLAEKIQSVHYPLIIAAAYSGFTLYGLGLSSTVPLTIATPNHFMEDQMGVIPLSETIFSLPMLLVTVILMISMPIFNSMLHPKNKEDIIPFDVSTLKTQGVEEKTAASSALDGKLTIPDKLNNSKLIGRIIGVFGFIYAFIYFLEGGTVSLEIVMFIVLFLGIFLKGSPAEYVETLAQGLKNFVGIVLQYPFYAGIMGILAGTGLVTYFANFFITFSTTETLTSGGLFSAFFVNFLAPSAGGQWAVQGPVMIEAAQALGTPSNQTAMSVMLGDTWNNLVQPFWILPILALSGLKLKDVMSYTVMIMLWVGIVFIGAFLLWGYL